MINAFVHPHEATNPSHAIDLFHKYINDIDYLEYISEQARSWYLSNCTFPACLSLIDSRGLGVCMI